MTHTYVAKLVEIPKQFVWFSKHEMAFHLNLLQRFHKTLKTAQIRTPFEQRICSHAHVQGMAVYYNPFSKLIHVRNNTTAIFMKFHS